MSNARTCTHTSSLNAQQAPPCVPACLPAWQPPGPIRSSGGRGGAWRPSAARSSQRRRPRPRAPPQQAPSSTPAPARPTSVRRPVPVLNQAGHRPPAPPRDTEIEDAAPEVEALAGAGGAFVALPALARSPSARIIRRGCPVRPGARPARALQALATVHSCCCRAQVVVQQEVRARPICSDLVTDRRSPHRSPCRSV